MNARKTRLLLVDDHSIVRMGFATLLGAEPDFEIVAEAEDAAGAVECFRRHRPDVTLMDVKMPGENGLHALKEILGEFPGARIIMLTTYDSEGPVFSAWKQGAAGCLPKSVKREELVRCIRLVRSGERCFPASFHNRPPGVIAERLSPREQEALELIRLGYSNKDIGTAMEVSENTAKAHVKSILRKLGAADRAEAVAVGFDKGLLGIMSNHADQV